jgi:hypothetical protein
MFASSALRLQFDSADLRTYASGYKFTDDAAALAAGQRIANGERSFENLSAIFEWKTKGRGRSRLEKNKCRKEEIEEILGIVVNAKSARAKVAVLTALDGVDVPVASAILTAIDPKTYTIIDYRALEALGSNTKNRSINFYIEYLNKCRELAATYKMCLRDFDRALWQWSAENSKKKQQKKGRRAPL